MATQPDPEGTEFHYLQALAPLANRRVLEIGCGEGRLMWNYGSQAGRLTGLDPNPRRLAGAIGDCPPVLRPRLALLQGQAEALPFSANSFELVLWGWSL